MFSRIEEKQRDTQWRSLAEAGGGPPRAAFLRVKFIFLSQLQIRID